MLNSLVRLWKSNTRSVPSRGIGSGRFTPRVETLDGRVMPAALHVSAVTNAVAVVRSAEGSAPAEVAPLGGAAGGVIASHGVVLHVARSVGEEIPQ